MTDTEQSLLALLRRALFGQDTPLPPDADWQSIFEEAASHSVHLLVYDCLTEREADIIRRRYGLEGHPPQTQRQVAAVYGISRSYVSRIEKRALEKLEKELRKG